MQFFFGKTYQNSAKYLWHYICEITPILNYLLLGAIFEGELQGVASVTPPEKPSKNSENAIALLEEKLIESVGEEVAMR